MFKENRSLFVIALIVVVNALGYGIVIPILYSYSVRFGLSDFQNGLLFALFSVCQFISTPFIGRMSDKYGRKPLLLGSIIGTALSFVLMAFAPNALFLFLARALDGITAGNIPVAMAVISDTTDAKSRAKGFGILGAAFGFGFVFGPAISAFTVGISPAMPFIVAAAITVVAVVLTIIVLPETNQHMGEVKEGKLFDVKALWHMLFDPQVGMTFLISLLYFLAFACAIIYGFQPFVIRVLGITAQENAILFTVFGLVGLISQMFFVNWFSKKYGLQKAFSLGILATALSFVLMFVSRSLALFVFASMILGFFNGVAQTLIPTILSQETDEKSQGSVMGLNASYQSIGFIVGPIMGGVLASIALPLPFLVGAVLMLGCYYFSFKILKSSKHKESAF